MIAPAVDKPRYPRALALQVARELCGHLKHVTERLIVAGSLRRRKPDVGDIEILYIPKFKTLACLQQDDFLTPPAPQQFNLSDATIFSLAGYYREEVGRGVLTAPRETKSGDGEVKRSPDYIITPRATSTGSWSLGEKNKYFTHVASGIPVDFFSATESNWFNYLVCRTGGAENNVRIASAAQQKGWKWNPYGMGFTDENMKIIPAESEEDVFRLAGLPYLEPWQR